MPFNGSNRIEALFAFVDQYIAGDAAMRSGFDQIVGDLVSSVNALAAYLEALSSTGIDQRYLGRVVAVPTQRVDTTALQAGDFYVAGHADAGRLGLAYVYDGAGFDVVSDFASLGAFFKDTLSAAGTAAAARTALELGSMATQNTSSFAPASVATDVALAIKLLADGIAKSMTSNDWDNAHLAGPGTTMVQANAAALNAPVALNAAGIYVAYDASNGFVLAVAHSTGQVYYRMRVAATWGTWREIPTANSTAAEGDILYRAASAWTRLARGADGTVLTLVAGLPAWASGPGWQLVSQFYSGASQATVDTPVFEAGYDYAVRTSWVRGVTNPSTFLFQANKVVAAAYTPTIQLKGSDSFYATIWMTILAPMQTANQHHYDASISTLSDNNTVAYSGVVADSTDYITTYGGTDDRISGLRFSRGSGNVSGGKMELFRRPTRMT